MECSAEHSAVVCRCCLWGLLLPDAAPVGKVNNLQGFGPLNEVGQIKVDNVVANDDVRVCLYHQITPPLQHSMQTAWVRI